MIEVNKAYLCLEGNDIVVIEPNEHSEIDSCDVQEGLDIIDKHFPKAKFILFNHKYSYSYTFKAMFRLKEILHFKAIASVVGDINPKIPMSILQFLEMLKIKVPVRFFIERQKAIEWLKSMDSDDETGE